MSREARNLRVGMLKHDHSQDSCQQTFNLSLWTFGVSCAGAKSDEIKVLSPSYGSLDGSSVGLLRFYRFQRDLWLSHLLTPKMKMFLQLEMPAGCVVDKL